MTYAQTVDAAKVGNMECDENQWGPSHRADLAIASRAMSGSPCSRPTDNAPRARAVLVGVQLPGVDRRRTTRPISPSWVGSSTRSATTSSATVRQRRDALAAAAVLGEGKLKELAELTGGKGVVPRARRR